LEKNGYGNYQDKNLPKNKEININPQPYTRKEAEQKVKEREGKELKRMLQVQLARTNIRRM